MEQADIGSVCRALTRVAVLGFAVGTLALATGPSDTARDEAGLRFSVRCSETSNAGSLSCALVVSGLPAPLEEEATVLLVASDGGSDEDNSPPFGSVAATSGIAWAAPSILPGPSVLVSSHLPSAPPPAPPSSPLVPAPPPRGL